MTIEDVRLCNCAECGEELLGYKQVMPPQTIGRLFGRQEQPAYPGGHILGRPYCRACLQLKRRNAGHKGAVRPRPEEEPGPLQENALRQLEECPQEA